MLIHNAHDAQYCNLLHAIHTNDKQLMSHCRGSTQCIGSKLKSVESSINKTVLTIVSTMKRRTKGRTEFYKIVVI